MQSNELKKSLLKEGIFVTDEIIEISNPRLSKIFESYKNSNIHNFEDVSFIVDNFYKKMSEEIWEKKVKEFWETNINFVNNIKEMFLLSKTKHFFNKSYEDILLQIYFMNKEPYEKIDTPICQSITSLNKAFSDIKKLKIGHLISQINIKKGVILYKEIENKILKILEHEFKTNSKIQFPEKETNSIEDVSYKINKYYESNSVFIDNYNKKKTIDNNSNIVNIFKENACLKMINQFNQDIEKELKETERLDKIFSNDKVNNIFYKRFNSLINTMTRIKKIKFNNFNVDLKKTNNELKEEIKNIIKKESYINYISKVQF